MKFNYFKVSIIFFLGAMLTVYTNCGQPFDKPTELIFQGNVYGGSDGSSYSAFQQTVYPITRANCISCHTETQPKHADENVKVAHDAVISQFKVNFANIPASRLVSKLRDENHNCWSNCADNAKEMQTAIENWNEAIKITAPAPTPESGLFTAESDTLETEFTDVTNPLKSNTIRLNIDAAMLRAPMVLMKPVGEESYLTVPTNTGTTLVATDVTAGSAFMNFKVPVAGTYRVWALAHGPLAADNSFFLNILNGATSLNGGARQLEIPVGTKFNWIQVPNINANLQPGTTYSLEVRQREDGARIAGVIITSDMTFNGVEVDDYFGITMSYDLSGILKFPASLQIDVIDYDLYSYKFSKPRIVTATSMVYAKGLKLYVNGIYNPQHSTYTLIDKIATPTDGLLSTNSMIVVKDKGMSGDRIKFSFEQLKVSAGGATAGGAGGAGGGGGGETSLMAYMNTVYPISRSSAYSCVGCHMAVNPRHASDTIQTAHDATLTVVDFTNPANSRIVNKMKVQRHNCGAFCDDIGNQYINAIQEWKNRRP